MSAPLQATRTGPVKVEVVPVRPLLLRDRDAAAYLARSASWIRAMRAADQKAKREGLPLEGPAWIVLGGKRIVYKLSDLDAWIEANSAPLGTIEFSNRGGGR